MVGIFLHKVAPGLVKNRNGYFRDGGGSDLVQGATYEFWRAEPRREPDEGVL